MATTLRIFGDDAGKLLLRLTIGVLLLLHGVRKISNGVAGLVGVVEKTGLPGELGYLVYIGEVVAPILLIIGLWSRIAALVVAINMVVAIALAHADELFLFTRTGAWALELQGLFLFGALAIALLGAGRFSLGGAAGRWN
ncbi:MAG TPA: DoxX family protein [Burkholderiaceae bacterium]|nr:DoxX family protein [Burkholderiaceae bacterium]